MNAKFLSNLLTLLFSAICFAQFSKTHYIPPISNSQNMPIGSKFLYISTPSITPIQFTIKQLGGANISGIVSRDIPYVFDMDSSGSPSQFVVDQSGAYTILQDAGYVIEAEDLISVSGRIVDVSGNQAGCVVSKGMAALGTQFRIGGMTNLLVNNYFELHYTFVSVMATENNTTVTFSDIGPGAQLVNTTGNTPPPVLLNSGETFIIAVQGPLAANRDALIGSLVTADKPIAVNCGSVGGTNGQLSNIDTGFDQIVSVERTGKDYIFIKSTGMDNVERVLLIAHENNTSIFLNGNTTPSYQLNAGDYVQLTGADYNVNGNLYVRSDKNIFAYQAVGDGSQNNQANQEMFFVPPLSCQTPKSLDNIPFIEKVGNRNFNGRVTITTKTGSTLNFIIDGVPYTLAGLAAIYGVSGPLAVVGNPDYECYIITGLTGNVSVFSTTELYLAAYGNNGAATFGGYYSGFVFKPEVVFQELDVNLTNCIPNVSLNVNAQSGFDTYQWYFNNVPIPGATTNSYTPTQPGYYKVNAALAACGIEIFSDEFPVSTCPNDLDGDLVNDNIDVDMDNDGIANCTESYGNQYLNLQNPSTGTLTVGAFSRPFTGTVSTSTTASTLPFASTNDGTIVTDVPPGKTNWVKYQVNFSQPISLGLEYAAVANTADLINDKGEYIITCPINQTVTVDNPDDQLLIDTNYDGFFESGVTRFSSFEIRFRLNSAVPLAAGSGTFKFQTYLTTSLAIQHKNLVDDAPNRATFRFYAVCVPKDSDADGVADALDIDSDNDGILDVVESQGPTFVALSGNDANDDGLDDIFGPAYVPNDFDGDGVPNYLDLDSDNDGIYDITEAQSGALDTNLDGIIDAIQAGTNGLHNGLENPLDSGTLNYTLADSDGDGIFNYVALDADNDLCADVIEAGFTDPDANGVLGAGSVPVNANGVVTGAGGYTPPNPNYSISAPISITTAPQDVTVCELQNAVFTVVPATPVDSYQWQVSTNNGTTWTALTNGPNYTGVTTNSLTALAVTPAMVGYRYRVVLNRNGNSCGLNSPSAVLTTYALPVVTTPLTLVQCDNDTDGISSFNLTQKNNQISANAANETFTYFTSQIGAETNNVLQQISNVTAYTTTNTSVWVRVENVNQCFRIARLNLIVSATQIPAGTRWEFTQCDFYVSPQDTDTDGIATFNFSSVTGQIQALLPNTATYTISYYKNEADALAENDSNGNSLAIANPANYANVGYPNTQQIWVRVDSNVDNACFGLGPYITLTVQALPSIFPLGNGNVIRSCDDDQDGSFTFNTATLESSLLQGQTGVVIEYIAGNGSPIPAPFPPTYTVTGTETIQIKVSNANSIPVDGPCFRTATVTFIVDDLPELFAVAPNRFEVCDDETDPALQNGTVAFDTTSLTQDLIQGQTGFTLTYTLANGTVYANQLPNPFVSGTQTVLVTLTNPINTSCSATYPLSFVVHPRPLIDINAQGWDDTLICSNLPFFTATLTADVAQSNLIPTYTYQWYIEGTLIPGATQYSLTVNQEGTYSVEVTNPQGCTAIRVVEVNTSVIATIDSVTVVDLVDNNTITVNVSGNGDYVYSIDESYGPYQTSNVFTQVPMGVHTVYVKDLNGCGIASYLVTVLGIPAYFTPNGDGFNDTWNIRGVTNTFYPNTQIFIYDRYGKLLKQIGALGAGWDGTYNGAAMPGDDYWYVIQLEDGRLFKGNFSLKR
jgi:gliding motility-associated-like protein